MNPHRQRQFFGYFDALLPLLLFCLVLVAAQATDAKAASSSSFFMQQAVQSDENGRSNEDRARRGPATPEVTPEPIDDLSRPCDADDCSKQENRRVQQPNPSSIDVVAGTQATAATISPSLQIQTGAPANSVHIADDGDVGIGTQTPLGRLHVVATPGDDGVGDILVLDENGNLEIGGLLTEASSVLLKENFATVDGQEVLDRLATVPVLTWNYKSDDAAIRHMGPMAQDFYAAFGLGKDEAHLAPLDANGVALAAIQALSKQVQTQATHIVTLEAQQAALLKRLEALEALVQPRDE